MNKTSLISYTYNPVSQRLQVFDNGQSKGGLVGPGAEQQYMKLLEANADVTITIMDDKERKRKLMVRRLRALWIKQGIDKHRMHILYAYGVESTADLSIEQLDELITIYSASANKPSTEKIRSLRSNALVILTRMGIYKDQNWEAVNAFLMDKRVCGKLLYQCSESELRVLVRKLNSIDDKRKATLN